jgi:hypothetical protein
MESTNFEHSNSVLGPPPGVSEDDVRSLNVWQGIAGGTQPVVISCWKPTKDELEEIARTGRVYLYVYGQTMPPVAIESKDPWG